MFALEIEFHDGISSPETILVRRTQAIVGNSEQAHVVIEGTASSICELRLVRGLGREFRCQPIRRVGQENASLPFLEGSYSGEAEVRLGDITARVTSLDSDLCLLSEEFPDQAALRILRAALSAPSPTFPAVAVLGAQPVFLSFPPDQPLVIGRSRKCGLRLDGSAVSSEHARIGVEGNRCWVEDLGSTNGTFVGGDRVSGRRTLEPDEAIKVGSEFVVLPILSASDIAKLSAWTTDSKPTATSAQVYPCILSTSDQVQPQRFVMGQKGLLRVGRDPANDIWISPSHISRKHLEIEWSSPEQVSVMDFSSNGSYLWGERLPRGLAVDLAEGLAVLDLCSGVVLAVCRSREDEMQFLNNARASEPAGEDIADEAPLTKRPSSRPSVVSRDEELEDRREAYSSLRDVATNSAYVEPASLTGGFASESAKPMGAFDAFVQRSGTPAGAAPSMAKDALFGAPSERGEGMAYREVPGRSSTPFDAVSGMHETGSFPSSRASTFKDEFSYQPSDSVLAATSRDAAFGGMNSYDEPHANGESHYGNYSGGNYSGGNYSGALGQSPFESPDLLGRDRTQDELLLDEDQYVGDEGDEGESEGSPLVRAILYLAVFVLGVALIAVLAAFIFDM